MRSKNTACSPILGSANELVCVNGIWRQAKQDSSVDYSDGQEEESILRETLTVSYTHLTLPTNREV